MHRGTPPLSFLPGREIRERFHDAHGPPGGMRVWVGLAVLAVLALPTQELVVPTPCLSKHRHGGAAWGRTDVGLSLSAAAASAAGVGGGGQGIQRRGHRPLTLLRSSAGEAAGPGGRESGKSRRRSDGGIRGAESKEESELAERVAAAVYEGGGFKKPTKGGEAKKIPGGTLAALCLVPPDGTRQKIEKIRGQLNKNGPRWAPQVPLLFFFLRPEQVHTRGLAEASEMIRIAMRDFAPFNITMDDMSVQLHRNEWATWVFPTNATEIRTLHAALSELFPRYGDIVPTGGEYMPHISLGQWGSRSEAMDAKAKARPTFEPLTWEVNEVAIMTSPGTGTPFSVWRNFSLQGPEKLDWEGLMPIKKMHWDLYEERKELLGIMRQIVKLQTGFERQERQNMAQLTKLMNFSTEAAPPLQIKEASSGAQSAAAGGGGKGPGDGVGMAGLGVAEAKSQGDMAVGGIPRGGIAEVGEDKEDVGIDIASEGGDEDEEDEEADDEGDEMLLQEGDDEGLLLQANDAKPLAREDGASSTRDKESEKFLELTRKVLEDLQATSIWGEEGIVRGTIDLEDLASPPPPISISEKTDGTSSGGGAGEKKSSGQQQGQQQGKQQQGQEKPGQERGKAKSGGRSGKSRGKRQERESADAKDLTHILLVRHGQSTWNAEGRWQGQADMPLSGMGVAQAALAAVRLGNVVLVAGSGPFPKIDAIYSSPMERANTTAHIISQQSGVGPVILDSRLRERSVGEWSGMTYDEVQQKWPGYLKKRMLPPSYETDDMVLPRVFLALDNVRKKHPGETVALVCHAGIIYAVEAYLKAQSGYKNPTRRYRIGNLGCRWIKWDGSKFKLGKRVSLLASENLYGSSKAGGGKKASSDDTN